VGDMPIDQVADRSVAITRASQLYNIRARLRPGADLPVRQVAPCYRAPVLCTPQTPWGIHGSMVDRQCSRCGWKG
jgi:hypothetical protein